MTRTRKTPSSTPALNIPVGCWAGVEFAYCTHHDPFAAAAYRSRDGQLLIDDLPRGIRKQLTQPFRVLDGQWGASEQKGDVCAVLGDGTEVRRGRIDRGVTMYEARGQEYPSILAAALALTPIWDCQIIA